jgi:hypothetical protein
LAFNRYWRIRETQVFQPQAAAIRGRSMFPRPMQVNGNWSLPFPLHTKFGIKRKMITRKMKMV